MITLAHCRTGIALAALLATGGVFANTMTKTEFSAAKDRIAADYKTDKAACAQSSGNARDICQERATGKDKIALAELQYSQSGKTSDNDKVAVAKANADFAIAREICDDKAGQAKDVCIAEAKTTQTKALADAKLHKKVGVARADASEDKRDADYKLATQKCESLAGETKATCVVDAKTKFGKS